MAAKTSELTNFHLGRQQNVALKQRARANGTNLAEALRTAVMRVFPARRRRSWRCSMRLRATPRRRLRR
jgi:hypothetical protein